MKENNEINEKLDSTEKTVDKKRRSVTKAGIVAPVVLTLASKSALGGDRFNLRCSISGDMSGNASHPDEDRCEGCTPGYWKTHPENWPEGYVAEISCAEENASGRCTSYTANLSATFPPTPVSPTMFSEVFTYSRGVPLGLSLMEVFWNDEITVTVDEGAGTVTASGNPLNGELHPLPLGMHAMAALFNSLSEMNFGNTTADILNWWNDPSLENDEIFLRYVALNERFCPLS